MAIRLHKEFGLNPTMPICPICRKSTGEIALLGAGYKEQAPMEMVVGPEPCVKCRRKYLTKGVLMINPKNGNLVVIKNEAFKRIFNKPLPPKKIAFTDDEVLHKLNHKQF